jgi:hypothetical protein
MEAVTYCNDDAIREVVEKFETCVYAPEEFIHARHLTVAAWYLCTLPEDAALSRMRESLLRFTAHHKKQAYHETITRFWMLLIADHLHRQSGELSDVQRVNDVVTRYPKETLFDYYSRDRVISETAKHEWIEPDLRQITERESLV